jgi:colanic acid/amylovoran biosynthesis glycosyltransferase
VASDVAGLRENIEENKTGWLVSPINKKAFEAKIIEVLRLPDLEKSKIKIAAQNRVKEKFNLDKQRNQFIDFYNF